MGVLLNLIGSLIVGAYFIMLGIGFKVEPEKLRGQKAFVGLGVFIILLGVTLTAAQTHLSHLPLRMPPKAIVEGIKAKLQPPANIDEKTRLDDVVAGDGKIIFYFSLVSADETEFEQQTARLRSYLQEDGCKTSNHRRLLESGIALEMNYAMMHGSRKSPPITLTPKGCGY